MYYSAYLIKRIDQGGGYVAQPGHCTSYTHSIERARIYPSKEAAEKDRCPENEIVIPLMDLIPVYS